MANESIRFEFGLDGTQPRYVVTVEAGSTKITDDELNAWSDLVLFAIMQVGREQGIEIEGADIN